MHHIALSCNALGMVKAFTNAANFSGMNLFNTPFKLSEIVHKAFFEVDNGLEAAVGPASAREGLIMNYSLWTQQPKVSFLISIKMATTNNELVLDYKKTVKFSLHNYHMTPMRNLIYQTDSIPFRFSLHKMSIFFLSNFSIFPPKWMILCLYSEVLCGSSVHLLYPWENNWKYLVHGSICGASWWGRRTTYGGRAELSAQLRLCGELYSNVSNNVRGWLTLFVESTFTI